MVHTLRSWGALILERRRGTHRSAHTDAIRWRAHVESSPFIDKPLVDIQREEVRAWLRELPRRSCVTPVHMRHLTHPSKTLSRPTVVNVFALLRVVLDEAVQDGLLAANPAEGLRVTMPGGRPVEPWTFLSLPEQERLLVGIPEPECWMVAFALYSGLRKGELFALRLEDLHVDDAHPHVVVRFGKPGRKGEAEWHRVPKNGRTRTTPLNRLAVHAARRWLDAMPRFVGANENRYGLAFPGANGGQRHYPPKPWARWVKRAELGRSFRWHDLRHTCAASLVSGLWGVPCRLEDVRGFLGHRDIASTTRYAHLAQSRLEDLAASIATSGVRAGLGQTEVRESAALSDETAPNLPEEISQRFSQASESARETGSPQERCGWDLNPQLSLGHESQSSRAHPENLAASIGAIGQTGRSHPQLARGSGLDYARSVLAAVARIVVDALATEQHAVELARVLERVLPELGAVAVLPSRPGLRKVSSSVDEPDAKAGGGTA